MEGGTWVVTGLSLRRGKVTAPTPNPSSFMGGNLVFTQMVLPTSLRKSMAEHLVR